MADQTDTGFRSLEPAAWQNVVVSVVVCPFLVAVNSIGRQVLPSVRVALGPTGFAATTVAGGAGCAVVVRAAGLGWFDRVDGGLVGLGDERALCRFGKPPPFLIVERAPDEIAGECANQRAANGAAGRMEGEAADRAAQTGSKDGAHRLVRRAAITAGDTAGHHHKGGRHAGNIQDAIREAIAVIVCISACILGF